MKGRFILVLGTLLVFSFALVACNDSGDDYVGPYAGTWVKDNGEVKIVVTTLTWTASYKNNPYNSGTHSIYSDYKGEGMQAFFEVTDKGIGAVKVGDWMIATIINGKMTMAILDDVNLHGTYSK